MVSPIFIVQGQGSQESSLHSNQSGTFWQVEIPEKNFGAEIAFDREAKLLPNAVV